MNLAIDIGNSRTKAAIFSSGELIELIVAEKMSIQLLKEVKRRFSGLNKVILSAVSGVLPEVIEYLQSNFSVYLRLNHATPVPIQNNYLTPGTLGLDRLAAAIGAKDSFPGKDLLVIDAGTALTFDLVESNGTYAGGNISPGLRSRFRALHEFTEKLPLVEESEHWPEIGQTTEEAIRSGVLNGMILEMDGTIDHFREKLPGLQPVLTGGDALFFERRLKNAIFVKFEITLIGLNRILEYNVEKL